MFGSADHIFRFWSSPIIRRLRWHVPPPFVQCEVVSGSLQAGGCFLVPRWKGLPTEVPKNGSRMAKICPLVNERSNGKSPFSIGKSLNYFWAMVASSQTVELPEIRGYSNYPSFIRSFISGWWFGTVVIFPYIGDNHPHSLIFFRG